MGKLWSVVIAMIVVMSACGSGTNHTNPPLETRVVELPGAADEIDFDDIVYSLRLQRVLVPARDSGLYLVEPDTATATRVPGTGNVASADEGRGVLFLADRSASTLTAINPVDGAILSAVRTSAPPDYVRYIDATGELWITEPSAAGIEIFALSDGPTLVVGPVASITVPHGPEGFGISLVRKAAYTHAGNDLVVINLVTRAVTARWATGCDGTHGFPRIDDSVGVVLASCANDGAVSLLDADDGKQLGRFQLGGGGALPAHSHRTGHFHLRADPRTTIATL